MKADAKMDVGGEVWTWSGMAAPHEIIIADNPANPQQPLAKATTKVCSMLTAPPGKTGSRPGLPIARAPGDVSTPRPTPPLFPVFDNMNHEDTHNAKNKGTAAYVVEERATGPTIVQVRKPGQAELVPMNLTNHVRVTLFGEAVADQINDGDRCHGADSAAGVRIAGATDTFRQTGMSGNAPVVEVTGRVFTGSLDDRQRRQIKKEQGNIDPFFVSLVDLTSGEVLTETVMTHEVEALNGYWELDDDGIRLVIASGDPDAFVELTFDQPSDWVIDPYSYSARLDSTGLTTGGELTSGWTLTTLSNTVEAFYAFGPEGMPYDLVQVAPPQSILVPDHDYTYDVGSGDAAYEHVTPEPGSAVLLVSALTVLPLIRRRVGTK